MINFVKKLTLLFSVFIICGCATITTTSKVNNLSNLSWSERQQKIQNINSWELTSSISVQSPNESTMAKVNWQQLADNYMITVSSVFNLGGVKLIGNKQNVTLWKSATDKITAPNPETLMQKELGWSLPIANMQYWIKGIPAPKLPKSFNLDATHHLTYLEQDGWQIRYVGYQSTNNIDLPEKVFFTNRQLQIKVVIKSWQIDVM